MPEEEKRMIACGTHGSEPWDGEVVCDCGRVHKIAVGQPQERCACGRDWRAFNAICPSCYRGRVGTEPAEA